MKIQTKDINDSFYLKNHIILRAVARNVSTEIVAKTQKKGANLVEIDS